MRGVAKEANKSPFTYNGWYIAAYVGNSPVPSPKGQWTKAEFKADESNSPRNEGLLITDKEDVPDTKACSMILEAFGMNAVKDGDTAETIEASLQSCVGKKCAMLLVAQPSFNDPSKSFHNLLNDRNVKCILPLSQVGKIYEGELKKNTATVTKDDKINTPENDLPF